MASKISGQWHIDIVGKLKILTPDQKEIIIKSGKSRSLIGLLILHPAEYLSREEIREILWPTFTPIQQSDNLRQAIAAIRKILPDDSPFYFERHACWIDTKFVNSTKIDDDLKRSTVLPDCDEPWFESWRRYNLAHHSDLDQTLHKDFISTEAAIEALRTLLDHTKALHPKATLKSIETFFDLSQGLNPSDIINIVTTCMLQVPADEPETGWGQLLRGIALSHIGKSAEGAAEIERVKQLSLQQNDMHLFVRAAFYQAGMLIVSESPTKALGLLKDAQEIIGDQIRNESAIHLFHGLGLAEFHSGDFEKGIEHLQAACNLELPSYSEYERAYVLANTAWMSAAVGEGEIAGKCLSDLESQSYSKPWRIMLTSILASSMLRLHEKEWDICKRDAIRVLNFAESNSAAAFAFYPHEILAICYLLTKDLTSSNFHFEESKRIREEQNAIYTDWDLHRLKLLF